MNVSKRAFIKYLVDDCRSHSTSKIKEIIEEVNIFVETEQGIKSFNQWASMRRFQDAEARGAKSFKNIVEYM